MAKIKVLVIVCLIMVTCLALAPKKKAALPLDTRELDSKLWAQLPIDVTSAVQRYQNWVADNNVNVQALSTNKCTVSPTNLNAVIWLIGGPMQGYQGQGSYDMRCVGNYSGCTWLVLLSVYKWEPFIGYVYIKQDCFFHNITCGGPQNLFAEYGSEFDPFFGDGCTYYCSLDIWLGNCTTGGTTLLATTTSPPYTFP